MYNILKTKNLDKITARYWQSSEADFSLVRVLSVGAVCMRLQ